MSLPAPRAGALPTPRPGALPAPPAEGARASAWAGGRLVGRFGPQTSELWPRREADREAWRKPFGYAGLGVGAALLGAGVYSTLRLTGVDGQMADPSVLAYRATLRTPQDPCFAARQGFVSPQSGAASPEHVKGLCAQASAFGAMQYAFYGAGALVSGLSALFLLAAGPPREAPTSAAVATAKRAGPPKTSWRLQPNVGRTSAGLTLHVRFF
ncbi:MAG TPA: hypothetical protein VFS00_03485 [Polyangiaceae bacterium]|nr:hypothetical protein [Polyangiaceae bacterium]